MASGPHGGSEELWRHSLVWLQVVSGSGRDETRQVIGWKVKVMQSLDVFLREIGTLKQERDISFVAYESHRGLCEG